MFDRAVNGTFIAGGIWQARDRPIASCGVDLAQAKQFQYGPTRIDLVNVAICLKSAIDGVEDCALGVQCPTGRRMVHRDGVPNFFAGGFHF
jgi:hypothetical protein